MRGAVIAAAALLLALVPAAPAAASYGSPQPGCVRAVAAVADGTVYGAGDCDGRVTVVSRRPGGSWRAVAAAWRDQQVEALAVDTTGVYVVVSCDFGPDCGAPAPLGKQFSIGKVPFRGGPTPLTVLGGTESTDTATVAARDGRWWAAWTETVRDYDQPGSGSQQVMWRKTFGGLGRGTLPVPPAPDAARVFSFDPSIALTGTGAAVAFTAVPDREGATPELLLASAGGDGRFTTSSYAPAAGASASSPDVAFSGGRLFVAWSRDGRPAVAFSRDGRHSRTDLPYRGHVRDVSVTASGGRLTVSTAEEFGYAGGRTTRVYARSLDAAAQLRGTVELTASAGRADPHVVGRLHDSTAARGLATVAFSTGARTWTASQS